MTKPLDPESMTRAVRLLDTLESDCSSLGLSITVQTLTGLRDELKSAASSHNVQWLMDQLKSLRNLIVAEMKGRLYVYIPPESAKYFSSALVPDLFGPGVSTSFTSCRRDILEAGACLATMRYTGSVFHLMRVLEAGLAALGAVFGIPLVHTNWGPALDQIESRIREMHKDPYWKLKPDHKDLQTKYAQAASTFGVLKDAWRNHTMHGRNFYELADAEHIYGNTKVFMQRLAALGLKEPGRAAPQ